MFFITLSADTDDINVTRFGKTRHVVKARKWCNAYLVAQVENPVFVIFTQKNLSTNWLNVSY